MIKSFKELEEVSLSKERVIGMDEFIEMLETTEVESLEEEIKLWPKEMYAQALKAIQESGMEVSESTLEKICLKNFAIAQEIYSKKINSTKSTEALIDAIMSEVDIKAWPSHGESILEGLTEEENSKLSKKSKKIKKTK